MMEAEVLNDFKTQLTERKSKLKATIDVQNEPEHLLELLREVDLALERIEAGTYGICEICHAPIEEDRLLVDPLITVCLGDLNAKQQRALEDDLELANRIQMGLLPKNDIIKDGWEISFYYSPAGVVSGDYCDIIINENEDGFIFMLGDVTGKGVAASMLMTQMHAVFHSLTNLNFPLSDLLKHANRLFCESSINSHFMTLVCGRANKDGTIELSNAGHCLPILMKKFDMVTIDSTTMPIGLFYTLDYSFNKVKLEKGESLILYSDGLSEAFNGIDVYGEEKIKKVIESNYQNKSKQIVEALRNDVREFMKGISMKDDLTIMAISRIE